MLRHDFSHNLGGSTVGQRSAGLFFKQGVGGSIPALVDVSLSKTFNPEGLPVAASTVYECNMTVSPFGWKLQLNEMSCNIFY